jgi:D-proline reductase (dithiol) PrdB
VSDFSLLTLLKKIREHHHFLQQPTRNLIESAPNAGVVCERSWQYPGLVPKLEDLSEIERQAVLSFPFIEHDDSPRASLEKPLSRAKLALVTTAGIHLRGDASFSRGDQGYRVIPSRTPPREIVQSHTSIGFDRVPLYRDINVSFPVDRVRELVERGVIGSLSDRFYSFLGAQRDPHRIIERTGPEVADRLRDEGADLVVLTPT